VIAGVPVGDNDFIKEHLENIVNPDVDSKKYLQLANHIAHLPDKQVSLLLMHKCLPSRLIHTARTTSPEHFIKEVGNKSDIINAWVLERIMCIPQTRNITLSQALNNNGKENTIILQHHQQQQLKLPIAKGGLGITSLAHISPAAYTAATAENVKKAISLATINNTNESPAITTNLGDSPLVHDILHSVSMLLDRGVSTSALAAILPAEWLTAATDNNIDYGHTVIARQLTATANTNSGNKCQAKIAALLHTQLLQSYEQSLDKLPSKEAACQLRCESTDEAKARHLSLSAKGAQSWLTCRIIGKCEMLSPEITMALRRTTGIRTEFGDGHCPFHPSKTTETQHAALPLNNHHAVTCPNTGLQNVLHRDMVYAMIDVMKETGVGGPYTREDVTCFNGRRAFTADKHTKWAMDITTPAGALIGATDSDIRDKQLLIDVSVRNPCGNKAIYEQHSNTVLGAAAAKAETDKAITYTGTYSPVTSTLKTAAFETFGRIGASLKHLLWQFVVHWASTLMGDQRATQMGRKMTRVREILSVALQKGLYSVSCALYKHCG